jgi:hypothetical protein
MKRSDMKGALVGWAAAVLLVALAAEAQATRSIEVTTSQELEAALTPENAGARIRVRAGDYVVVHPLVVPDGASLVGEGVMLVDESGLPVGFEPGTRTRLLSDGSLQGDILSLGDRVTVSGLVVEDVVGRVGNLIVIASRAAADHIQAEVSDCELINPNPSGIVFNGPTGRALAVYSRNLGLGPAGSRGRLHPHGAVGELDHPLNRERSRRLPHQFRLTKQRQRAAAGQCHRRRAQRDRRREPP